MMLGRTLLWKSWAGWFAQEALVEGQGTQSSFTHTWTGPAWGTLLLLLLLLLLAIRCYRREALEVRWRWSVLATLRFAIFGLVVFMLYGWVERRHRTELPELVIAIDTSASMATIDSYRDARIDKAVHDYFSTDPSRLGQAKYLLESTDRGWLKPLQQSYRLKLFSIGDKVKELTSPDGAEDVELKELAATDASSRLGDGVREIIDRQRGRSTAAILLLTDGITTDGAALSDVAIYAHSRSLPLYVVGLGSDQPPRDLRLTDLLVDDVTFVGDVLNFDVTLQCVGMANREATVRLLRDNDPRPLAELAVDLPNVDKPIAIRLPYRPQEEGDFEFTIEVSADDDEPNRDNNRLSRRISVRNSTIRVLLVQSSPSYEYRYLRSLLSRASKQGESGDRAVALTTVLQEADLDYLAEEGVATGAFPVQKDELFTYDVVIFGDADPAFFSSSVLDNLRQFVEDRGGGVVFIAGPNYFPKQYATTPLETLLPFDLATASLPEGNDIANDSFRVRPTPLGLDTPTFQIGDTREESQVLWTRLPEIRWLLEIPDVNTTAMVLADHPTRRSLSGQSLPVILMQFVGAGKVIFHATDETFLWSRYQGNSRLYDRYWYQTIRYLSRAKLLSDRQPIVITTDAQRYVQGDTARLRVLFRDERLAPTDDQGVTVSLEDGRGDRKSVGLIRHATDRGAFEATLTDLRVGSYQVRLASPLESTPPSPHAFIVDSRRKESAQLEMNANELKATADVSQGKYYTIRNASRLLASLPRGDQVRIESSAPRPIWNSSWLAALMVTLLTIEWILRKRAGLL